MSTAVTWEEVLQNREQRFARQKEIVKRTKATLISFSMVIPGEIKNNSRITTVFALGLQAILELLSQNSFEINELESIGGKTGPECMIAVKCDPVILKKLCCKIEEHHQYGRLFDIDILDNRLKAISRQDIGQKERSCLICDQAAHLCARDRTHSLHELKQAVRKYLL
jgi:holo-ACP synthase